MSIKVKTFWITGGLILLIIMPFVFLYAYNNLNIPNKKGYRIKNVERFKCSDVNYGMVTYQKTWVETKYGIPQIITTQRKDLFREKNRLFSIKHDNVENDLSSPYSDFDFDILNYDLYNNFIETGSSQNIITLDKNVDYSIPYNEVRDCDSLQKSIQSNFLKNHVRGYSVKEKMNVQESNLDKGFANKVNENKEYTITKNYLINSDLLSQSKYDSDLQRGNSVIYYSCDNKGKYRLVASPASDKTFSYYVQDYRLSIGYGRDEGVGFVDGQTLVLYDIGAYKHQNYKEWEKLLMDCYAESANFNSVKIIQIELDDIISLRSLENTGQNIPPRNSTTNSSINRIFDIVDLDGKDFSKYEAFSITKNQESLLGLQSYNKINNSSKYGRIYSNINSEYNVIEPVFCQPPINQTVIRIKSDETLNFEFEDERVYGYFNPEGYLVLLRSSLEEDYYEFNSSVDDQELVDAVNLCIGINKNKVSVKKLKFGEIGP